MKIWIDLANSPQVLFFRPLIKELERMGHSLTLTTRDFAQTVGLTQRYGLAHTSIGVHGGKKLSKIGLLLMLRAWLLLRFSKNKKFDLAVSHNSYSQALAAFMLRIPFVTLMDYEHQPANHLCFRLAKKVMVPECFPQEALCEFGASPKKTRFYRGLKEQVYLADFKPEPDYLQTEGLPRDRVLVVMRPPGSWGLYHHFENPLFDEALDYLARNPRVYVVFLPRVAIQADSVEARGYSNVMVARNALDGPNLLYYADLVISGGGTMNREAAVLGTPAYTIFKGRQAAVDNYLIALGRMRRIIRREEIPLIRMEKKPHLQPMVGGPLVKEISLEIVNTQKAYLSSDF
jgi:uncharacterized protein